MLIILKSIFNAINDQWLQKLYFIVIIIIQYIILFKLQT